MSKRNFTLLIIVLVIIVIAVIGFLYLERGTTGTTTVDNQGTNFFSNLNPFGKSKTTPGNATPPVNISGYTPPTAENPAIKLVKVSTMPIAGFTVFLKERLKDVTPTPALPLSGAGANVVPPAKWSPGGLKKPTAPPTEFSLALRYVEKATGNIYQTFVDKIEERKFSSTVIPGVYDSYFGNQGQSVVMRHLKNAQTIETFLGTIPKELLGGDTTGTNEIKGTFLPDNIQDISVSADNSKIFYLFNPGDSMAGVILNLSSNKKTQIFDSSFTEWLSQWPNDKMITFTTKPSGTTPGYMYRSLGDGKNLTKVLGNIDGLTTLTSPNGKLILYGNSNLSLSIYHTDSGTSDLLGIRTIPEKCTWNSASDALYCAVPKSVPVDLYPDAWYQGEVSFSDQLWKINIKTDSATFLLDPVSFPRGEEVDGTKLALDAGENYLFFVNKKDSFLWEFSLK